MPEDKKKKCKTCDARRKKRMQKPDNPQTRHINLTDVSEDLHKPKGGSE